MPIFSLAKPQNPNAFPREAAMESRRSCRVRAVAPDGKDETWNGVIRSTSNEITISYEQFESVVSLKERYDAVVKRLEAVADLRRSEGQQADEAARALQIRVEDLELRLAVESKEIAAAAARQDRDEAVMRGLRDKCDAALQDLGGCRHELAQAHTRAMELKNEHKFALDRLDRSEKRVANASESHGRAIQEVRDALECERTRTEAQAQEIAFLRESLTQFATEESKRQEKISASCDAATVESLQAVATLGSKGEWDHALQLLSAEKDRELATSLKTFQTRFYRRWAGYSLVLFVASVGCALFL